MNLTFHGDRTSKEVAGGKMGSIKGGLSPNMTVSLRGTEIQTRRHTKRRQEGSSNHGVEGQEGGGCHGVKQKEGSGHHGVKAQERDSCLQVLERGLERNPTLLVPDLNVQPPKLQGNQYFVLATQVN